MSTGVEFGFVAALEREVSGLVRDWSRTQVEAAGARLNLYRRPGAALICAGTGVERAYQAAKVLAEQCSPQVMVSIGYAGSCAPELRPGAIVVPAAVLETTTGKEFECAFGQRRLATLDRVAGKALKQASCERFGAVAVDMEAAGVARAAVEHGRSFAAIKAISDGVEEDLGFLSGFVKPEGFETGRFAAYLAFRPGLWPRVTALNRNSALAGKALAEAVRECVSDWQGFSARHRKTAAQV